MKNQNSQKKHAANWIQQFVYCYNQLDGEVVPIIMEKALQIKQQTNLSKTLDKYIQKYKYRNARQNPNTLRLYPNYVVTADDIYAVLQFQENHPSEN